jgi:hypothetical protein
MAQLASDLYIFYEISAKTGGRVEDLFIDVCKVYLEKSSKGPMEENMQLISQALKRRGNRVVQVNKKVCDTFSECSCRHCTTRFGSRGKHGFRY